MISSKSNETTRRILNFPAIRPCESVSYTTLITSLIGLGRSISNFKSRTFFTNKRNSKTSIRLIETLVLFLEEALTTDASTLDASVSLSFSELHFTFQKLRFLLEDCCARDGARTSLLMNSDKVSSHFRALTKSIAVALDVLLPLKTLNIPRDVEEIAELAREQALKARFEVERDDRRAAGRVFRVFDQFERGISPECEDLKRVLDYLGIKTWEECNKEVDFLENELGHRECDGGEEMGSVISLIAYMTYCRCIVFHDHTIIKATARRRSSSPSKSIVSCLNPEDFKCPISLEIMKDPVTVSTGHTYDRSSIQKWLESGNRTCPKTGERLKSLNLVPNRALESLISVYSNEHRTIIPSVESKPSRSSLANSKITVVSEQAMALVSHFLVRSLARGTEEERNKAAHEIRILAKTSDPNRSCLIEADAIPSLLSLLRSGNPEVQGNTASGLLHLSRCSRGKKVIAENGGLEEIVRVLTDGLGVKARRASSGILFHLSSVNEYRKRLIGLSGLIPGLMSLLYEEPDLAKKNALVAIRRLVKDPENHWSFLSSGVVASLIRLLTSSDDEDLITDSLSVLGILADKVNGAMVIVSAGTIDVVVKILCSSDRQRSAKELCVSLLLSLCINDREDAVRVLVKNRDLMGSLYSVLVDGSSGSKEKASSVIRILHEFNEKTSPPSPPPGFLRAAAASDFRREQFVHAW